MKSNSVIFIKECIILFAFIISAFWIIITGVFIIPSIADRASDENLLPLLYSLGTLAFSVMIIYSGFKYLKVFGLDKIKSSEKVEDAKK